VHVAAVAYIGFNFGGADYVFDFWVEGKKEAHYYEKKYFNTIRLLDCLYIIREIRNSIFLMIYYFLKVKKLYCNKNFFYQGHSKFTTYFL
jgi:hypothetical protein